MIESFQFFDGIFNILCVFKYNNHTFKNLCVWNPSIRICFDFHVFAAFHFMLSYLSCVSYFSMCWKWKWASIRTCCCSVAQSCQTLCSPMDWSTPGFPVLHYFPEFAPDHVHWVDDVIQPSYPLSLFSLKGWETVFTGFGVCD